MTSTRYCKKALMVGVEKAGTLKTKILISLEKVGRGLTTQSFHVNYIKQFFIPPNSGKH